MARQNEDQALREYSNRKKRLKRRRNFIISVLLVVLAVAGAVYFIRINNRKYQSYEVINTAKVTTENAVGYISYGSSIIKYSKDGASAIDKDGNQLWNGSYEMMNPIADTCEDYAVIADKGNKSIHIFNKKGEVANFQAHYNIIKAEVGRQGVVAVLMEEGNNNYIYLYDTDETLLWKKVTSVKKEGYPLDFSLSNDALKLVASYLTLTEGKLISNVPCYNLGEVGKNYTDQGAGGWALDEGILVPKVAFVNNDTIVMYQNDGFKIISMPEIPNIIAQEKIEGKILSVLYNEKYTGVVLESKDGASKRLMVYNLKGKKVLDKSINYNYKKIYLAGEEIIMHDDMSSMIMKINGSIKFKGTFEEKIEAIYPINNLDRYYLISGDQMSQISLIE